MKPLTWQIKVAIGAIILLIITGLLLIIKYQHDLLTKQAAISNSVIEQKQLSDNILRSQLQYATKKDLEQFAKDLGVQLKPIKDDLNKFNAKINGITSVKVITTGKVASKLPSDNIIPRPTNDVIDPKDPDPFGYLQNTQVLKLNEPFADGNQVPWGEAKFSAWRKEPWDLTVYKRQYSVVNVLGVDEDGRHYVYNKFSVESNGKNYDIKISNSKFVEEYPSSSFSFNPHLFLGVGAGTYLKNPDWEVTPNLQVTLFSYGQTKRNPEWVFLGLGPGYEINNGYFSLLLSPVSYNIGTYIPLINNTYIGPSVSIDAKGGIALLMGLSVGL